MSRLAPPPTWADVSDPAWLNWFLSVSTGLDGVGRTIAAGFNQSLSSSPDNYGTLGGSISTGDYYSTSLSITLQSAKRLLYWAEVGMLIANTTSYGGLYSGAIYRNGSMLRQSAVYNTDYARTAAPVMLFAEDLDAGDYDIQLGANVSNGWSSSGQPLIVNPRVLLLYAP